MNEPPATFLPPTGPPLVAAPPIPSSGPAFYSEATNDRGTPRSHWRGVYEFLERLPPGEFDARAARADELLRENGVTFNIFAEDPAASATMRLDLLPLVQPADDWSALETALAQRAHVLELTVRDLYGPQTLLHERVLPPEAVLRHPGFFRTLHNLRMGEEQRVTLYAAELARTASGQWWVMADRADSPAGAGYALENRLITNQCLSALFQHSHVERLASFFARLRNALRARASHRVEDPRIVLLSPGPQATFYFEDVFLARYLGYTLVEGGDLAVRNDRVFLKTLEGLLPVDVIYCRGSERGVDPLELGGAWGHGVPGLLQAVRAGNVSLANTPGCGIIEAPVFMPFLPSLCQYFLKQDLKLPSIATWWCGQPEALEYVLDHLQELVIKPAYIPSGGEEIIVARLSPDQREALRERLRKNPGAYVAQELVARSAAPVWKHGKLGQGHIALRAFAVAEAGSFHVMPGGLVRVAATTDPLELAITAGDLCKDLWVLADGHVDHVTLLQPEDHLVPLRRTGALFPSRVADNLFWLGQAIERSDFLGRVMRSLAERLLAESNDESPDIGFLARLLAEQGMLEPGYALKGFDDQLPSLTEAAPKAAADRTETRGLAGAVEEMRRLSSLVRDWLSPDTWRRLHHGSKDFLQRVQRSQHDLGEFLNDINALLADLAAAIGLIQDGMTRGPSWRFVDLGRRLEGVRDVSSLLRTAIAGKSLKEPLALRAILEVLDCQMTYRIRYFDRLQQHAILDLMIADDTNPHSLAFRLSELAKHVDALPSRASNPLRTDEEQLVMACLHRVRMLNLDELSESPPKKIHAMLGEIESNLNRFSDVLTRTYLVHSGVPQQITEPPVQP